MIICFTEEELAEKYIKRSSYDGVDQSETRKGIWCEAYAEAINDYLSPGIASDCMRLVREKVRQRVNDGNAYVRSCFTGLIDLNATETASTTAEPSQDAKLDSSPQSLSSAERSDLSATDPGVESPE